MASPRTVYDAHSPLISFPGRAREVPRWYEAKFLWDAILLRLAGTPSGLLGEFSRELSVSQRTIEKGIIIASGKTFRKLREEILVERVRSAFACEPTREIKGLASELGYKSPRSFARAIKRACGSSPEELRSRIIRGLVAVENAILS